MKKKIYFIILLTVMLALNCSCDEQSNDGIYIDYDNTAYSEQTTMEKNVSNTDETAENSETSTDVSTENSDVWTKYY